MIEEDLKKLTRRDSVGLDGLTADIWRREAQATASARTARRLTAWQTAVMAVAVISSASFGMFQAASLQPRHGALFVAAKLAPSSLILGGRQ